MTQVRKSVPSDHCGQDGACPSDSTANQANLRESFWRCLVVRCGTDLSFGEMESDERVAEALPSRRKLIWRWSYFLLVVFLTAITLVMMLRSDDEGWEMRIYLSSSTTPSGDIRLNGWSLQSAYAHVGVARSSYILTPYLGTGLPARFYFARTSPNLDVLNWPMSISYAWIIAIECLALFFMVPSVISKTESGNR